MKTMRWALVGFIFLATVATVTHLTASDDRGRSRDNRLRTKLVGFNEVPIVSTVASGRLKATIADDEQSIDYELEINDLQGIVAQAHIHLAQKDVNGGIVLWLCQGTAKPADPAIAALTPTCPQEGTVSGNLTSANVTPVATQQIAANELGEVIAAIRAGNAYANVHSDRSPGGEIRGQIDADHDHGGHNGK